MTSSQRLLRDLTLSAEAPMAFCLRLLLQKLTWTGPAEQLFELMGQNPQNLDLVDARNLLLRLGYGSRAERLEGWSQLNPYQLPCLYLSPGNGPYVIYRNGAGSIEAANVSGRMAAGELAAGGQLVVLQERQVARRLDLLRQLFYRFNERLGLLYAISFGLSLLALALPFYIRGLYNLAIPANSIISTLWLFAGVMVLFGLDWLLRQWRGSLLAEVGGRLESLLGAQLVEKLFSLDYRQIEALGDQFLYLRQRNLESLLAYLQGPLALACLDMPFVLIYLAAVAMISGWLVMVPLVLMALTAVLVVVLSRYYAGAAELSQTSGSGIGLAQQELVNRFLEIKTSNTEWVWLQRLRGLSAQTSRSGLTLNLQTNRLQALLITMSQLAGVLTLGVGAWLVSTQQADPRAMGSLIASMFFVWRIFTPFQQLMNALLRFRTMEPQYQQLKQFLALRPAAAAGSPSRTNGARPGAAGPALPQRLQGHLELEGVACRLSPERGLALGRVSLAVAPGEILAVTGPMGSGKSVVLKVIDQLYPIATGTMLFDGRDHRQFTEEVLQQNIGYLMSSSPLLPGSVWSNLTAMAVDANPADVRAVCDELGILEALANLPEGLDTPLSPAVLYAIPLGVRRMISLAQVVLKGTPILLLDDLSQGLAPEQFERVSTLLPKLARGGLNAGPRSVILATDNRTLLEQADRLCILNQGITAFQGTAAELRTQMQRPSA